MARIARAYPVKYVIERLEMPLNARTFYYYLESIYADNRYTHYRKERLLTRATIKEVCQRMLDAPRRKSRAAGRAGLRNLPLLNRGVAE
jgi:hypothetical protein